jgi:hypothetical protein
MLLTVTDKVATLNYIEENFNSSTLASFLYSRIMTTNIDVELEEIASKWNTIAEFLKDGDYLKTISSVLGSKVGDDFIVAYTILASKEYVDKIAEKIELKNKGLIMSYGQKLLLSIIVADKMGFSVSYLDIANKHFSKGNIEISMMLYLEKESSRIGDLVRDNGRIDEANAIGQMFIKTNALYEKYSRALGLEFTHSPTQNSRISSEQVANKSMFYTSFSNSETLYQEVKEMGFKSTKIDSELHWTLNKEEDDVLISVSYIEGDVYLYIIYDDEVKTDYFIRLQEEE